MCGFVALVAQNEIGSGTDTESLMNGMLESIEHRGPDDSGTLIKANVALGFRRLSILDLTPAGHQPMQSNCGRFAIVFNGEIYNYVELRSALVEAGHQFRSSGDTEVLLAACIEWGESAVEKLVGMFAFCFVDFANGVSIVARDRFGIKPLFYAHTNRGILFSSEIKAIRRSGLIGLTPNIDRFSRFLANGRTEDVAEDNRTFVTEVLQLRAGEQMVLRRDGAALLKNYWNPWQILDGSSAGTGRLAALFDESIRLHLRADVPVGIMLSGGVDSVSLACRWATLAHGGHCEPNSVHAFTYASSRFDESREVADAVQQTGVMPHVVADVSAKSMWESLPLVMWHHDEPFHSPTVLVGYWLYGEAAENGIKVALSGQGADEVFGGYYSHYENALFSHLASFDLRRLSSEIGVAASAKHITTRKLAARVAGLAKNSILGDLPGYRARAERRLVKATVSTGHLTRQFAERLENSPAMSWSVGIGDVLREAITRWSLPQYLRVEDRNSMAHSIESRVPFLDHRLVEYALGFSTAERFREGRNKVALRDAMEGKMPASVLARREKLGFPTSASEWFRGPVFESLRQMILDGHLAKSGWISPARFESLLRAHKEGSEDNTDLLFAAAQVEIWLGLHFSGWEKPR